MMVGRRALLAGVLALHAPAVKAARRPSLPLGLEAYTIRRALAKDPDAALRRIAALGYRELELAPLGGFGRPPLGTVDDMAALRVRLAALNLTTPSVSLAVGPSLEDQLLAARRLGARWFVAMNAPGLARAIGGGVAGPAGHDPDLDRLKMFSAAVRSAGLKPVLHVDDTELAPREGGTLAEAAAAAFTDAELGFEIDLGWQEAFGRDPARTLEALRKRAELIHVKHLRTGCAAAPVGADACFVGPGEAGALDLAPLLTLAQRLKVRHAYVEIDEPSDVWAQLARSAEWWRRLSEEAG